MAHTPHAPPKHEGRRLKTFKEFYPFYSSQHKALGTRTLHVIGTSLFVANCVFCVFARRPRQLLAGPVVAYGLAWVGHFCVERNRPATFSYPLWSLIGDFKMWWAILSGREPWALP